ncbi:hypothetical protein SAMN02787118_101868 [Streptomyces mirabilis]|jgi:hypothetical protein|uniref:Uncharacterized protein n=1 Tax=Streptomyces mirabilis TaxID=68239 RepID=A0A1I2AY37_9ACTN|nr:hypothetical protein SAMN02787118_101868 [Streptomyces mirabilis]
MPSWCTLGVNGGGEHLSSRRVGTGAGLALLKDATSVFEFKPAAALGAGLVHRRDAVALGGDLTAPAAHHCSFALLRFRSSVAACPPDPYRAALLDVVDGAVGPPLQPG